MTTPSRFMKNPRTAPSAQVGEGVTLGLRADIDAAFNVLEPVDTPSDLLTLDYTIVPAGTLKYVGSIPGLFRYDPTSSASPDGTTILASGHTPGRWLVVSGGGVGATGPTGPTGPAGEPAGKVYYFDPSLTSDVGGYNVALASPSTNPETTLSLAATGTAFTLIATFATELGEPGVVSLPAGNAGRLVHAMTAATNQVGALRLELWRRTAGGVETLLRTDDSQSFFGAVQEVRWDAVYPLAVPFSDTDRIIFRLYGARVSGPGTCNITCYFDGSANVSYARTTISTGAIGPTGPTGPTGGTGPTGPNGPEPLYLCESVSSTQQASTNKKRAAAVQIDSAWLYMVANTSTITFHAAMETTSAGNQMTVELWQLTGTSSPQLVATLTTTATSVTDVSTSVSTFFRPSGSPPTGVYAVLFYLATNNGTDYATLSGAWLSITP